MRGGLAGAGQSGRRRPSPRGARPEEHVEALSLEGNHQEAAFGSHRHASSVERACDTGGAPASSVVPITPDQSVPAILEMLVSDRATLGGLTQIPFFSRFSCCKPLILNGEMAEWSMAHAWKTCAFVIEPDRRVSGSACVALRERRLRAPECSSFVRKSGRLDSNQRPSGPESDALPRLSAPIRNFGACQSSVKSVRSSRTEDQFADFRLNSRASRQKHTAAPSWAVGGAALSLSFSGRRPSSDREAIPRARPAEVSLQAARASC
jgi:hypothetical protein